MTARYKLVWFVPEEALAATRDAVFGAGAGRIGDYDRCVAAEHAEAAVAALVEAHPYEEVAYDLYPLA